MYSIFQNSHEQTTLLTNLDEAECNRDNNGCSTSEIALANTCLSQGVFTSELFFESVIGTCEEYPAFVTPEERKELVKILNRLDMLIYMYIKRLYVDSLNAIFFLNILHSRV